MCIIHFNLLVLATMKNISHFLNFKNLNAPVIQWLATITRISEASPVFCNTFHQPNQKGKEKNVVLETDNSEDFSEQKNPETSLPKELQNNFSSNPLLPIFNFNEVIDSERLFSEIIDTELLLISCNSMDENKGIQLDELSSKIINNAKCPIILIPDNVKRPNKFNRVIFNSDIRFTELRLVKSLAKICNVLKSKLTMAHVSDAGIPDLGIDYGKDLFSNNFKKHINDCELDMENVKKLDIQKYPDLIHEFLSGDIYSMINKNRYLKDGDYLSSIAIKFAAMAKTPVLILNS